MTDLTNYGKLRIRVTRTNTVQSGITSSNGDLIVRANSGNPSNFQTVSNTLVYNAVTPTFSFSSDTQIKGVKDPEDDQDATTQNWIETRTLNKESFDCYYIAGTDAGINVTVAASGASGQLTPIMQVLAPTLINNTNFSINIGQITYNGTKDVTGNVIARVSASAVGTAVYRISIFKNVTMIDAAAMSYTRIESGNYGSGALYISCNISLSTGDTLDIAISDTTTAGNTTTCNVVAYQFSFLGYRT